MKSYSNLSVNNGAILLPDFSYTTDHVTSGAITSNTLKFPPPTTSETTGNYYSISGGGRTGNATDTTFTATRVYYVCFMAPASFSASVIDVHYTSNTTSGTGTYSLNSVNISTGAVTLLAQASQSYSSITAYSVSITPQSLTKGSWYAVGISGTSAFSLLSSNGSTGVNALVKPWPVGYVASGTHATHNWSTWNSWANTPLLGVW